MGGRRSALTIAVSAAVAGSLLLGSAFIESPIAEAAKKKPRGIGSAIVACPGSVARYKLDQVKVYPDSHQQWCKYEHRKKPGWLELHVSWHVDAPGERDECGSRQPQLEDLENYDGLAWSLESPTRRVSGGILMSEQGGKAEVSLADAEARLRQLIAATEPLAHPCVPAVQAEPSSGLSCPLLLRADLVRTDWYRGETPAVEVLGDGSDNRHGLDCTYKPAYAQDGDVVSIRLEWKEGDPSGYALCNAGVDEYYHDTTYRLGYHPVAVRISNEFVERWGGQVLADALVAAAATRTQRCPTAPEGPAPYASATIPFPVDPATGPTDTEAAATATTIVLSGGPGEERPSVGTTIEVPVDEQHQLVIGGQDGEVIREEYLGDQATISGYGPLVTDADGNWSVLVTVDVTTAPEPAPPSSLGPSPAPTPAATPELTLAPTPDTPSPQPTTVPVTSSPSPEPALESPPAAPTEAPGPEASPTAIPPPELIGVPESVADLVAGLPPEGAGAVRDLTDHLAVLGELLETEQSGEVTVPASDIGSLRELLPDLVQEVWLTDGSIVVATNKRKIGNILVEPVIGDDGLISVKLSQYQFATFHPVVRALVAALNGYVAERGGLFSSVSVTPEGLTVSAVASTQE